MAEIQEGQLIRPEGFAEVFTKDPSGEFRHIESPEALTEEFGEDAFSRVTEISAGRARDELGLQFNTAIPPTAPEGGLRTQDGQPVTPPTVTDTPPDTSDVAETSASEDIAKAESRTELENAAIKASAERTGAIKDFSQTITDTLKEFEEGRTSRAESRAEAREEFNVVEKREKRIAQAKVVAEIKGKLDKLRNQELDEIEKAENRLASTAAIRSDQQEIQTKFARLKARVATELNAEAALLAVFNDELNAAESRVDQFVQDATFDEQMEARRLDNLINVQTSFFNALNEESKTWLNQLFAFKQNDLEAKQDRFRQVMNLQVEAAKSGVTLGWSTEQIRGFAESNESLTQATNKFNQAVAPVERAGGGGQQTQTERALASAQSRLNASVNPETGNIDFSDYMTIRSGTAIETQEFDSRFGASFLSDEDKDVLDAINIENSISNSGLAG